MDPFDQVKHELKALLVQNLMLTLQPEEITDDLPLFGADGLGLDSVDALQLVVALDKTYGLKIPDAETARTLLANVTAIATAIVALRTSSVQK
jgi:acyl carrier protein